MRETNEYADTQTTGEITAAAGQSAAAGRLTWQQILADPEYRACYDRAVQDIVRRRLKNRSDAEARLNELSALAVRKSREDMMKVFRHLDGLLEQARELMAELPDFELMAALEDPMFLRLTAPHTGLGLSDAWYALHREEIGRRAARESLEKLSRSLMSGAARPREMGGTEGAAEPVAQPMSRAEREALKKRIYAAGALKQKVYPN